MKHLHRKLLRWGATVEDTVLERLYRRIIRRLTQRLHSAGPVSSPLADAGLLAWGRHYLAEHFRRPPSKMHLWLGKRLDPLHRERGTKLNVIGPRGGAKSTIGTLAYVLRAALEGWEPYIWVVSDTSDQAQTHLENIKAEIAENRLLAADYPHSCAPGRKWQAASIELANGVAIESFGTGQSLRGRRKGASRPSLIVCDDLQNDGHIQSALQRETSRDWFHSTLLKAGDKRTNLVNLATALHREALAMELHETPGWVSARFRAIERWPMHMHLWKQWEAIYCNLENLDARLDAEQFFLERRPLMEEGAELLWPAEEDLYTLMRMRVEEGASAFEREKQSSPLDHHQCEWPEDYFAEEVWFAKWPERLQFKVVALDPSKGRDARYGDYSAFVVLGADRQGVLYVEADLARRPTPQIVADGVQLCRRHRADALGVEANQFQELLADQFVEEFRRQGLDSCIPYKLQNHVNKGMRIRRLGSYLSQRRFRFLRGSAGTGLLVNQLRDFPAGSHDDGPDALEMALRLAERLHGGSRTDDGLGNRLPVGK